MQREPNIGSPEPQELIIFPPNSITHSSPKPRLNFTVMEKNGGLPLNYWLQWQVLVCALIFALPATIAAVLIRRRKLNSNGNFLNSAHLWLPCWRHLHPRWLLFYRAFAFLSMAFLLYQLVLAFGFFVFFFYTQYVSLCTSFIFLINLLFVIDLAPNLHNLLYDSSASASFLGD